MAKKPRFPVKSFDLSGSALTNTRRAALVKAALEMTAHARVGSAAAKIERSATATGSGHVAFKGVVVPKPGKAAKKPTKAKDVVRKVKTTQRRRGKFQNTFPGIRSPEKSLKQTA